MKPAALLSTLLIMLSSASCGGPNRAQPTAGDGALRRERVSLPGSQAQAPEDMQTLDEIYSIDSVLKLEREAKIALRAGDRVVARDRAAEGIRALVADEGRTARTTRGQVLEILAGIAVMSGDRDSAIRASQEILALSQPWLRPERPAAPDVAQAPEVDGPDLKKHEGEPNVPQDPQRGPVNVGGAGVIEAAAPLTTEQLVWIEGVETQADRGSDLLDDLQATDGLSDAQRAALQHIRDLERRLRAALAAARNYEHLRDENLAEATRLLAERDAALAEYMRNFANPRPSPDHPPAGAGWNAIRRGDFGRGRGIFELLLAYPGPAGPGSAAPHPEEHAGLAAALRGLGDFSGAQRTLEAGLNSVGGADADSVSWRRWLLDQLAEVLALRSGAAGDRPSRSAGVGSGPEQAEIEAGYEKLPPDHAASLRRLEERAAALARECRLEEALSLRREIVRRLTGSERPPEGGLAEALRNLAAVLRVSGQLDEARQLEAGLK